MTRQNIARLGKVHGGAGGAHSHGILDGVLLDGTLIASGSEDKHVRLWDAGTGECAATLKGHTDQVMSVALPDGTRVVSGSADESLRFWDLRAWD